MGMHKGLLGKSEGGGSVGDKTLSDYIRRKNRTEAFNQVRRETFDRMPAVHMPANVPDSRESLPKKLTFDEWWKTQVFAGFKDDPVEYLRNVWQAAQENK